jgi:hypothetical protein
MTEVTTTRIRRTLLCLVIWIFSTLVVLVPAGYVPNMSAALAQSPPQVETMQDQPGELAAQTPMAKTQDVDNMQGMAAMTARH